MGLGNLAQQPQSQSNSYSIFSLDEKLSILDGLIEFNEIQVIQPTLLAGLSKIVRFKVEIRFVIQRASKVKFSSLGYELLWVFEYASLYGLQVNEFIAESADNMLSFNKVIPS